MKHLLSSIKVSFVNFLAFFVVAMCFTYFFYISSSSFPPALVKEISDVKIALITVLTGVMGYFFGASNKKGTDSNTNTNTNTNTQS